MRWHIGLWLLLCAYHGLPNGLLGRVDGQDGPVEAGSVTPSTELFGIPATGTRVVYVFDTSASTEGAPLRIAKRELRASIRQLKRTNQVQIVFYNHVVRFLSIRGESPRLYWVDDETKRSADRFIDGVRASGGTNHMDALKVALDMQPDVIYFYTDADDPQLSEPDLARIRTWNGSAAIHAIQFGHGARDTVAPSGGDNFLVWLAEQNGGQYRYIDVTEK